MQNLLTDTIKMALYTANASLDENTATYSAVNEVTDPNYTAGGKTCQNVVIKSDSATGIVYVTFDNVSWSNVSFTCRGALIYNGSKSNKSVAILNFGSDKTAGPNFVVTLPADTPTSALIRV